MLDPDQLHSLLEALGAYTGIVGAVLLATRSRYMAWVYPLWIVSGISLTVWAILTGAASLRNMQAIYTVISMVGVYNWLLKPQPTDRNTG